MQRSVFQYPYPNISRKEITLATCTACICSFDLESIDCRRLAMSGDFGEKG